MPSISAPMPGVTGAMPKRVKLREVAAVAMLTSPLCPDCRMTQRQPIGKQRTCIAAGDCRWCRVLLSEEDVPMPKCKLVALTTPLPGKEAEFHDWYQNTHLKEITSVPGFEGAQRFQLVA